MNDRKIGIVGAGVMGASVSEDLLANGFLVVLIDVSEAALDKAKAQIRRSIRAHAMLKKARDSQRTEKLLDGLTLSTRYESLSEVDLIVENVSEDVELKKSVYKTLDSSCKPDGIFIANTSCIPITRLASFTKRPEQVIGVHFMNPVPLKQTVELIVASQTSKETKRRTCGFLDRLGKDYIAVHDSPGFVSNRVLMLTINEASFLLHEGVSDAHGIDAVFKRCLTHRMGPLETADMIGLDTILQSLMVLYECFGDVKFRPSPLLKNMVDAGRLGRKSGRGFFEYS